MYSMTIVGGGKITSGYDNPKNKNILTHLNGALRHPKIKLHGIVETDIKRQKYILNKWGKKIKIFSSLKESLKRQKSDIFVIANPTNKHLSTIKELLNIHNPKLIICEKPLVSKYIDLKNLDYLETRNRSKIVTNFPRRFEPSYGILKKEILKSNKIYHFYGTFSKGLIHNGCHMIDLISMLIGNIIKLHSIKHDIIRKDFFGKFMVETENSTGVICNIKSTNLSVFELTIYTDNAKFEIVSSSKKIIISNLSNSNIYKGFDNYLFKKELKSSLNKTAYNTFDYLINLIENTIQYKKFKFEQRNINKILYSAQKKFMKKIKL